MKEPLSNAPEPAEITRIVRVTDHSHCSDVYSNGVIDGVMIASVAVALALIVRVLLRP